MQSQDRKSRARRVPKGGCFFSGLRIGGILLVIVGVLILLGGVLGFVITLFRTSSDLVSSLRYFDQQVAQFSLLLIMTWLGTFTAVGCTGLVMIVAGFGLGFAATEAVHNGPENPIDKPLSPA